MWMLVDENSDASLVKFRSNASLEATMWKVTTQGERGGPQLAWDAQSKTQTPRRLFLVDGMLVVGDWDILP